SGRGDELREAFSQVVSIAVDASADFLLVAGDCFDSHFVGQSTIEFALSELKRFGRPAVLLPGNHDHAGEATIFERLRAAGPHPNVILLDSPEGTRVRLPDLDVEVWGRAHLGKDFAPLGSPPTRGSASWQIALAHGHVVPRGRSSQASYQIAGED